MAQTLVIFLSLMGLSVVGLIQVEEATLLLEMIVVQAEDGVEVVSDQEDYADPF